MSHWEKPFQVPALSIACRIIKKPMREKIFYLYQSDGEEFKSDLHFFIKILLDHSFKLQSLVFFSEQK